MPAHTTQKITLTKVEIQLMSILDKKSEKVKLKFKNIPQKYC